MSRGVGQAVFDLLGETKRGGVLGVDRQGLVGVGHRQGGVVQEMVADRQVVMGVGPPGVVAGRAGERVVAGALQKWIRVGVSPRFDLNLDT